MNDSLNTHGFAISIPIINGDRNIEIPDKLPITEETKYHVSCDVVNIIRMRPIRIARALT